MPDEKLQELALRLYERHKEAIDFIFECRPEPGSLLGAVRVLVEKRDDLLQDHQIPSRVRFAPREWLNIPALNSCPKTDWTKTGRTVLFEVYSKIEGNDYSGPVRLTLVLGPSNVALREHIFKHAHMNPKVFAGASKTLGRQWATLFNRELMSKAAANSMDEEQRIDTLTKAWNLFLERDLPALTKAMIDIAEIAETSSQPSVAG